MAALVCKVAVWDVRVQTPSTQADAALARARRLLADQRKRAKRDGAALDYGSPPWSPKKAGYGGDALFSLITSLHVDTIRRGREELDTDLQSRPPGTAKMLGSSSTPCRRILLLLNDLQLHVTGVAPCAPAGSWAPAGT